MASRRARARRRSRRCASHYGATCYLLPATYYLLPTTCCVLRTTYYLLPPTRCVALRQKRHALATEMARHPNRQGELEDARYGVSRAEGGLQLLTAVIDGGQLTGARVVDLLAELRHLEEREMAELLPMEEASCSESPAAPPAHLPTPPAPLTTEAHSALPPPLPAPTQRPTPSHAHPGDRTQRAAGRQRRAAHHDGIYHQEGGA